MVKYVTSTKGGNVMYEIIENTVFILLFGVATINTIIQVKGNKISNKRKKVASATLTIGGCAGFIWLLIIMLQTIQEKIIKVSMLEYLFMFFSAIWFITGVYLLLYCKKQEKNN